MKTLIVKLSVVFGPIAVPSLILFICHLFFYQPSEFAILAVYLASLHVHLCAFLAFQLIVKPRAEPCEQCAQRIARNETGSQDEDDKTDAR